MDTDATDWFVLYSTVRCVVSYSQVMISHVKSSKTVYWTTVRNNLITIKQCNHCNGIMRTWQRYTMGAVFLLVSESCLLFRLRGDGYVTGTIKSHWSHANSS